MVQQIAVFVVVKERACDTIQVYFGLTHIVTSLTYLLSQVLSSSLPLCLLSKLCDRCIGTRKSTHTCILEVAQHITNVINIQRQLPNRS